MSDGSTTQAAQRSASDIAAKIHLSPAASGLLRADQKPGEFLTLLLANGAYVDAIRFMAHALRMREAVWWGCLCVRHTAGDPMPEQEEKALRATVTWVREPSEENAKAVREAVAAAGTRSPAGFIAQAAGHAAKQARVRTAKAVAAAIFLAVARSQPGENSLNYRQFVAVGLDVDDGSIPWE